MDFDIHEKNARYAVKLVFCVILLQARKSGLRHLFIRLHTRLPFRGGEDVEGVRVVDPGRADSVDHVLGLGAHLNTLEVLDDLESKAHSVVLQNVSIIVKQRNRIDLPSQCGSA